MYRIRDFLNDFCEREKYRLFHFIPVLLGSGICFYFNCAEKISFAIPLFSFLILCSLLLKFKNKILYALLIFCFGFLIAQIRTITINTPMIEKEIEEPLSFFATIESCEKTEFGLKFIVKDASLKLKTEKLFLTWKGEKAKNSSENYMPGDRVSIFAKLVPLSDQAFSESYNFKRQQYFNGISARGFILSQPKKVDYIYCKPSVGLFVQKFRHKINEKIDSTLEADNAAIAKALITGTKSSVGKELRENFVRSGAAHVLAISGLHMGIIGLFIFGFMRLILCLFPYLSMFYSVKKIAAGISLFGVLIFYFISGCSVSSLRALIMHALVIMGIILNRCALTMRSVATAATIILLITPEVIMFPSFQLSFSAVFAIVAFYEKYWNCVSRFKMIFNIVATTIAATLATSIFSVFVFNQLTLNGILANIFIIPLMTFFIMPMIVISLAAMLINITFPLKILSLGISVMIKLVQFCSALPGSLFVVHSPSVLVMSVLIFSALIFTLIHHRIHWVGFAGIIFGVVLYRFQEVPRIVISPYAKAYGVKIDDDLVCFNHCGYFRGILSAWTKSVGCIKRENFKSKSCRKFAESPDEHSVKVRVDGQDFFITDDEEFLKKSSENYEKNRKNVIFLDKSCNFVREIYLPSMKESHGKK